MNDARALDLPKRRFFWIVPARGAGGIYAIIEHGVIAATAVRARRRHSRGVFGVDAQRIDEAVAVVVAQIHDVGVGDLAIRVSHADVAFGMQPFCLLVIDDLVGLDACAVVKQLHVADRRDPRIIVVVVHLDRLDQHLSIVRGTWWNWPRGPRIVGEALRRGRSRGANNTQDAGKNESEKQSKKGVRDGGQKTFVAVHRGAPPDQSQTKLAGGDDCHYPSSWYSKAKKPVRPPTNTGSQAEAIGCINSALLKSSVTLDKT